MKTLLVNLVLLIVLLAVSDSFGQGLLIVTSDPEVPPCADLIDDGVGVKTVYVVLSSVGAHGVRFAIEESPGITLTYIGETHPVGTTSGTVHGGLTVCLLDCSVPITLATIDYMSHGTSALCSEIRVVSPPGFDGIDMLACTGSNNGARVAPLYVNLVYPHCNNLCNPGAFLPSSSGFSCQPVPVQETTWGAIKALYD